MKVLYIFFEIINLLIFLHTLYFGLFALSGLFRKVKVFGETDHYRRFAVLIPARNEELVIGNLVESIAQADYPSGLIETYVLVNNTTDNTAEIASAGGANVMECTVPTRTKSDVLRFAFDRLRGRTDIDTYIVFDADNIVDPLFFREINKAHAAGFRSAQAKRTGKSLESTWVSSCYEIYYTMQNAFFNHPRNAAGLTAAINGTGWSIDKSVIDEHGFDMTTIAEDHEFTLWCAMNSVKIAYCSKATVYDEFTDSMRVSIKQRFRWSFGMLQNLRKYEGRLLCKALRGSVQCFDMAMVNILPLVVLVSMISTVLAYFFVDIPLPVIPFVIGLIAMAWAASAIGSLVSVLKAGCSVRENIKGIIGFPVFIITWAPLLIICLFRRKMDWAPIRHDKAVSIEDKQHKR